MFDAETPLEEICRGFNQVIEDGKAFYWATSNWNSVYFKFNIFSLRMPLLKQFIFAID